MKAYCYDCKKEVKPRCQRCGHDRTSNNSPLGLCSVCKGRMVCPACGTRRFGT